MEKPIGVEGEGMGIGLVGPKYWYSCGAEYMPGLIGLVGEWMLKSILARLLKLGDCWMVVVVLMLLERLVALTEAAVVCTLDSRVVVAAAVAFAMGNDRPRSLPRLATPTPQVRVVRYPEHSFPISIHWPQ
jgi:hypothetical protein